MPFLFMKVRLINKPEVYGFAHGLNPHAICEVIVHFVTGDADSIFCSDLDVWLEKKQEWKSLPNAMRDHDVITDNYNSYILEPPTEEDRKRGYTL